jgi:hypothetical protein
VLDNDEIGMIINHEHECWWINSNTKIARNAVSDMYAYISYENKEFSLQILNTLLSGLQRTTFDLMKIYERPLVKMLLIKD